MKFSPHILYKSKLNRVGPLITDPPLTSSLSQKVLAVSIQILENLTLFAEHVYELIWHWYVVAQLPGGFTIKTGICITYKSVLFYHMTLEVSSVGEGSVADMTFSLFPL